jgi:hypothetical protein
LLPYSGAASDAIGLTTAVQKVMTNPYVQASLSSAGLADANSKILRGDVGKDFEQDVFTALEYVPYVGTVSKYIDNVPKGASQFVKDLKLLPQQIKRKLLASKRTNNLLE